MPWEQRLNVWDESGRIRGAAAEDTTMIKAIRKVLLLFPPAVTFKASVGRDINPIPPLGIGYIAAMIEAMGVEVRLIDCLAWGWDHEEPVPGSDLLVRVGLSDDEIKRQIIDFGPDLIGISCMFSRQHEVYMALLRLCKQAAPECVTLAGGAHVSVAAAEVLANPACDYILLSEAENSVVDFITALGAGQGLAEVDGIGFKRDGEPVIMPKRVWIEDLDAIPFPAYHLMHMERYDSPSSHGRRRTSRYASVITSRGCPAYCNFCSVRKVWGKGYRMRSVENVIAEMRLLKDRFGILELMFEDDNLTSSPKRVTALFERMIEERFNFVWDTPNGTGAWTVSTAMLDLMQRSGCMHINFPIESGSQRVLKEIIRKPVKLDHVSDLIRHCKKINLEFGLFLIVGLPGETIDDMWSTFEYAERTQTYPHVHISIATPYPGTRLYQECLEKDFLARSFSFHDLFIRSYMIKTPDWSEDDVKRIYEAGTTYLYRRHLLRHPDLALRQPWQALIQILEDLIGRKLKQRLLRLISPRSWLARLTSLNPVRSLTREYTKTSS